MQTEITRVTVHVVPQRNDNRVMAFASITLNGEIAVHDLKVIRGNNGLFVAMPNKRKPDGTFMDITHPVTPEWREYVERVVLSEYHKVAESAVVNHI